MAPGQTFQGFLLSFVLSPNISKEKLQEIYDKWTAKYYPYGGVKSLETSEFSKEKKNE